MTYYSDFTLFSTTYSKVAMFHQWSIHFIVARWIDFNALRASETVNATSFVRIVRFVGDAFHCIFSVLELCSGGYLAKKNLEM